MQFTWKPRRQLFQVRLSTMLAAVVVCAAVLWIVAQEINAKRQERAAIAAIRLSGGGILYDWQAAAFPNEALAAPPGPAWARKLLGDDFFAQVFQVNLTGDGISADLTKLRNLHEARALIFEGASVSGLENLGYFEKLETLDLIGTNITDKDVKYLRRVRSLRVLFLGGTKITDAALRDLEHLNQLWYLDVSRTPITTPGSRALAAALPSCDVVTEPVNFGH